ncbi:MAG: hypothetical protein KKD13_00855, partial [Candidatus Margulisbacteria bacterium]|nr:hypothetical protein [Candidatus Margulisiibacteriota bacterium]
MPPLITRNSINPVHTFIVILWGKLAVFDKKSPRFLAGGFIFIGSDLLAMGHPLVWVGDLTLLNHQGSWSFFRMRQYAQRSILHFDLAK